MATRRQIAANRRNARKSTGPRTLRGKLRSRRNALRHGLTGETVITVFENAAEYQAFENGMVRAYRPRSIIEHELVVRLSSLLWRLRRATAIETGLFSIQAELQRDRKRQRDREEGTNASSKASLYEMLGIEPDPADPSLLMIEGSEQNRTIVSSREVSKDSNNSGMSTGPKPTMSPAKTGAPVIRPELLAQCFRRVARLDNNILERISRYEVTLWRQAAHVAMNLHTMQNRSSVASGSKSRKST